jgi:hypothetical protein
VVAGFQRQPDLEHAEHHHRGTRNWSRSAIYWNVALDQNNGPRIGGCDDCRGVVTINTNTGAVSYAPEYYAIAHASKFVRRGAQRISSTSFAGLLETSAFKNPDGSKALIALNPQSSSRFFDVVVGGEHFEFQLLGESVATFVWDAFPVGDFDQDGDVDFDDIDDGTQGNGNSLFDYLGVAPARAADDLDDTGASAGVVDAADLHVLVEQLIGSQVGDISRDYQVDAQDVAQFVQDFGSATGYFAGDLDASLTVDLRDFAVLQLAFQPTPEPSGNLLQNPGFLDLDNNGDFGDGWGTWGSTNFADYWGGNPHASFFADQPGNFGGVFQLGITASAGTTYEFKLLDVRVEANADADFRFGLEFYALDNTTKIGEVFVALDVSASGDGLSFVMSAIAPPSTRYVRPVIQFDNVSSLCRRARKTYSYSTPAFRHSPAPVDIPSATPTSTLSRGRGPFVQRKHVPGHMLRTRLYRLGRGAGCAFSYWRLSLRQPALRERSMPDNPGSRGAA